MTLTIRLLGSPELYLDDTPVTLPGFKPLALFSYLLLNPKPQQRQHLVDQLFDQASDPRATLRWSLSQLRKIVGTNYFISNRNTIGIDWTTEFWLDTRDFLDGDRDLYRGDFLQGIEVRDGQRFMDWLYLQRESFRNAYRGMLEKELDRLKGEEDFQGIIKIGHQLLQIDNLHEGWYQVLMRSYIQIGRKDSAIQMYETCRQLLERELGLQPSPETQQVYRAIEQKQFAPISSQITVTPSSTEFPILLQAEPHEHLPFVAREEPLGVLNTLYEQACRNQGQAVFIRGSAGRGKTSLVAQFIKPLMQGGEIWAGYGSSNAFNDVGDAYLPFREIFDSVSGNFNWALGQSILTLAQAQSQLEESTAVFQTIIQKGPLLFDRLVSLDALVKRLTWLNTNEAIVLANEASSSRYDPHIQDFLAQTQLFQQTTDVLTTLSKNKPVVLIIDDLQWCDQSSLGLLFHLARRIQNYPIFIICTYRFEESNQRDENDSLSWRAIVQEIQRLYGNDVIDLEQLDEDENRRFVEAYLQSQYAPPSDFFKKELFQYTQGHPLFTIELLHSLDLNGQLVVGDDGLLSTTDSLATYQIPERIEAVIELRLRNLPEALRELLFVGAVEGVTFSAQVVSKVIGLSERKAVSELSKLLVQKYNILLHAGQRAYENRIVDLFKFHHKLLHNYFLQQMNPSEKRLLHGEIAEVKEKIVGSKLDTAVLSIATHYEKAGLAEKAVHFYRLATEQAFKRFAHDEVIQLVSKSINLLTVSQLSERYNLLRIREQSFAILARRKEQTRDLKMLFQLAGHLNQPQHFAEVALRHAIYHLSVGQNNRAYAEAETAVINATQTDDSYLQAMGQLYLGRALLAQNKRNEALTHFEKALTLSKQSQSNRAEATSLRSFGEVLEQEGEITVAESYYQQSLDLSEESGHFVGHAFASQNLGEIAQSKSEYLIGQSYFLDALHIFQEIGHRQGEAEVYVHLGMNTVFMGDYYRARQYLVRGLMAVRKIGNRRFEVMALSYLGFVAMHIRDGETAVFHCQEAQKLAEEQNEKDIRWLSNIILGRVLLNQEKWEEAEKAFRVALANADESQQTAQLHLSQAGLALIAHFLNDHKTAQTMAQEVWHSWDHNHIMGTHFPIWMLMVCYTVLEQSHHHLANAILNQAKEIFEQTVTQFAGNQVAHQYFEAIPEHRLIMVMT